MGTTGEPGPRREPAWMGQGGCYAVPAGPGRAPHTVSYAHSHTLTCMHTHTRAHTHGHTRPSRSRRALALARGGWPAVPSRGRTLHRPLRQAASAAPLPAAGSQPRSLPSGRDSPFAGRSCRHSRGGAELPGHLTPGLESQQRLHGPPTPGPAGSPLPFMHRGAGGSSSASLEPKSVYSPFRGHRWKRPWILAGAPGARSPLLMPTPVAPGSRVSWEAACPALLSLGTHGRLKASEPRRRALALGRPRSAAEGGGVVC